MKKLSAYLKSGQKIVSSVLKIEPGEKFMLLCDQCNHKIQFFFKFK